ncbi:hypothetical protein [Phytohalomonas tamaricis]|uniref:hypothetical protein n=1 Tax=Phytohalomonas tamaricis TaxID=2081032 RepID=UPI0021D401AD|nr:hypothetical protein [Phytohalomonas tamaricis]
MKRAIGAMITSWLRKPENRRKAKQTAQQLWDKYQHRKNSGQKDRPTRDGNK